MLVVIRICDLIRTCNGINCISTSCQNLFLWTIYVAVAANAFARRRRRWWLSLWSSTLKSAHIYIYTQSVGNALVVCNVWIGRFNFSCCLVLLSLAYSLNAARSQSLFHSACITLFSPFSLGSSANRFTVSRSFALCSYLAAVVTVVFFSRSSEFDLTY